MRLHFYDAIRHTIKRSSHKGRKGNEKSVLQAMRKHKEKIYLASPRNNGVLCFELTNHMIKLYFPGRDADDCAIGIEKIG